MTACRVVVVPQTAPDYRREFYDELDRRLDGRLRVVTGWQSVHGQATVADGLETLLDLRPATFLLGRRLLYQHLPWQTVLEADIVVADLNPRVLSTWPLLAARRRQRLPTLLWGHAWPIRGREAPTEALRNRMRRNADALISYTATQARALRDQHPGLPVFVAPNAIYRRDTIPLPRHRSSGECFVYVGRLIPAKKPALALRGFAKARTRLGSQTRLVVVGEGPLDAELRALAVSLGIAERVEFRGHVSAIDALEVILGAAVATLSPGYAGLSLTQSLYCGVPVIVARDEPHSPEIETLIDGVTGSFFETDDEDSLAGALIRFWQERDVWAERRRELASSTREQYCVEAMAQGFIEAIEHVAA